MVDLLRVNRVQYVWDEGTGDRLPLCYLYFCKYCLDIRSAENLQHEVDSHFCPQSLDGVPTTEAALKKNKSANCWQCPACPFILATRAMSVVTTDPEDPSKQITKKTYYLVCSFCRWSSRDVEMEDKTTASGGWSEKDIPNMDRINEVIDYYKYAAQKELSDMKNAKRRGYKSLAMQLQQKYGSAKLTSRKPHPASPLSAVMSRLKEQQDLKQVKLTPSPTFSIQDIENLPEDTYTKQIDFTKLSSISQRLSQPEHQTAEVMDYMPRRAMMFVKRSLRCKQCQHNLIKPEYHPSSIKFKMQLVAIHYVPEIRIHKEPILKPGERTRVTLVAINRTDHPSHITLQQMFQENLTYPVAKSQCDLPSKEMTVSRFQEAEFGLLDEAAKPKDDPTEVAFRDANKLGFYVWVTPNQDLKEGDEVWISFNLKYDHRSNTAMLLKPKSEDSPSEPEVNFLCHRVFVNLGRLSGSSD